MVKRILIGLMSALLCLSVVFYVGCASKQTTVKSENTVTDDTVAKAQKDRDQKDAALRAQAEKDKMKDQDVKASAKTGREGLMPNAIKDIHFDFDMSAIRTGDRDILLKNANYFLANKDVKTITIEGYCDERGTAEYNLALGQRRADEAKKYLTAVGVDKSRMETISYGKEKPVDPRHNEEAWAKNRRAHFVIN